MARRRTKPKARILVVDDDKSMLELLKLHLSNAGYDVVTAEDAVVVLAERPRLLALAMTITRDPGEGEDAVQETLLSAWSKWTQLRGPDSVDI